MKVTDADIARFWAKVDKSGECWLWTAGTSNGYGNFGPGHGQWSIGAHIYSWRLTHGDIPSGFFVCHDCPSGDNRLCVRPDHLFLGTRSENSLDMWKKGRGAIGDRSGYRMHPERFPSGDAHWTRRKPELLARGERNGMRRHPESVTRGELNGLAKLTAENVISIRQAYAAGNVSQTALAREYGITQGLVSKVVRRDVWQHV